jgi:7-carboxy-7-deazaguanine synthase
MNESLLICELFKSIQGESTFSGAVCVFLRLAGCNLNCTFCDTSYARDGGTVMTFSAIHEKIERYGSSLVEITGGEPLLQQGTAVFVSQLLAGKKTVLVETNGSLDIGVLPAGCIRIVDVKCPSSGMSHTFLERNITHLQLNDEVKFVIGSKEDFTWARSFIEKHSLDKKCTILFSPVVNKVPPADIARWIIDDDVPVRLQLQLHKLIWGDVRGV